jgi:UDP-N-acetylglucosamine diphosphorylase/glucosamine-1-phosphate N-acetyltransferase
MASSVAAVILAAGLGKRMKSPKAKVLHEVLGKPMVAYVLEAAKQIAGDAVVVVVGNQAEAVQREVSRRAAARFALQEKQLGTGHAVMCAVPHLPAGCGHILVLCGDVPLVSVATLKRLVDAHIAEDRDATVLVVDLENPHGYGRVLVNAEGRVRGIVEEADASEAERAIRTINTGTYCIRRAFLEAILPRLGRENAQGEFYLTDIVRLGYEQGLSVGVSRGDDPDEFLGVNTPRDLERIEGILSGRQAIIP